MSCVRVRCRPTMDQLKTEARLGALEGAMAAAVRDYKAEVLAEEEKTKGKVSEPARVCMRVSCCRACPRLDSRAPAAHAGWPWCGYR